MGNNNDNNIKRKRGKGYTILVTLFVLVSVGISGYAMFYNYLFQFNIGSKNVNIAANNAMNNVEKKTDPVTVLVMGIDSGNTVDQVEANQPTRTDTMLLMKYDPVSQAATIVSIPRDTMVFINGTRQKINAAHAIGGVDMAVTEVEELLGIDINYYAKLDYEGFRKLIDNIGGIEVTIQNDMYYDDPGQNLKIRFNKGETVLLDGKKAEEFFRWRENNDGTGMLEGDIGRIQNQHMFISKVIDKFKSISIIPKIPSILNTLPKYIETNMPPSDMIAYGVSFLNIDKSNIKMATLNGIGGEEGYVDGISYYIYQKNMNKEILDRLNGIYTSEKDSDFNTLKIKVNILNGTGIETKAWNYKDYLNNQGFEYVYVDDSKQTAETSKIDVYNLDESLRETIQNFFGIDNIIFHDGSNGDYNVVVTLGKDYKNSKVNGSN